MISCDSLFNTNEEPNELGGDTENIPISEVDNHFTGTVKIDNQYCEVGEDIYIEKNDKGIITLKFKANIKDYPQLKELVNLIPSDVIDSQGNINAEFKMKVTSEGIQDYFNKDGKPHTIVKYNCKVGDKYELKKSDGTTITRTVTAVSDQNDFPYGLLLIKTITVEQDSRIPGVKKIVFRANHKFGLVFVEFQMEDGTNASSYIFSQNS